MKNFDDDFGFSFDDPITTPVEQKVDDNLLRLIEEHKELVTKEVQGKLREVESLILPLLTGLQKQGDKDYIYWPNRVDSIQRQIEKITNITRS